MNKGISPFSEVNLDMIDYINMEKIGFKLEKEY